MNKPKCIVIGGTGATGKHLIRELLASPSFSQITSLVRNEDHSLLENEKLKQVVVNFDKLEDYKSEFKDKLVAFDVLGTTKKQAGSAERFREIDYGYSSKFSELCKESGVQSMHLLTSAGANENSWFLYPRTKGEIENKMKRDNFHYLSIFRPSFLNRGNSDRSIEVIVNKLFTCLPVENLAKAIRYEAEQELLNSPSSNTVRIYNSKDIDNILKKMEKEPNNSSLSSPSSTN